MFDPSQFRLIADTFYTTIESKKRKKQPGYIPIKTGRKIKASTLEFFSKLNALKVTEYYFCPKSETWSRQTIFNHKTNPEMGLEGKRFVISRTSSTTCKITRME